MKYINYLEHIYNSRQYILSRSEFDFIYAPCYHANQTANLIQRRRKSAHINSLFQSTAGSRFATARFTTIHFYDPCRVGPSNPDLWCITVATQASFLYLVRFQLFSSVFLLFLLECSSFKLTVILPSMKSSEKTKKEQKSKQLTLNSFLISFEPRPGPSSTK